jgi:hypothetical protein
MAYDRIAETSHSLPTAGMVGVKSRLHSSTLVPGEQTAQAGENAC